LLVTARHMLIDSYRRGRVEDRARRRLGMRPLTVEDEDLERIEAISEAVDIAQVLAAQLSDEQWQTLRARVIDERDYPSIASELGCSEAVVRQRVSRALKTLRNALED
jgi:RNA polymerase sigma-70 factor (ECF subfamily)